MEEFRRFLRYVVPGLCFTTEVILYLLISDYQQVSTSIEALEKTGVAIVTFLASGSFGFLLSLPYHSLSRFRTFWPKWLLVDFRQAVKAFARRSWLQLQRLEDDSLVSVYCVDKISQIGAWRIITTLWNEKIEISPRIKGANERTARMVDIVHALGTTTMGSFFAILVWGFIHWRLNTQWACPQCILVYFISLVVLIFSFCNFRKALKDLQSVVIMILDGALREESTKKQGKQKATLPQIVSVSKIDFDKKKKNHKGKFYE